MSLPATPQKTSRGDTASTIVVVASLIMLWASHVLDGRPLLLATAVIACLAYLLIGVFGFKQVDERKNPALTAGYFTIQLALGGGVTVLGGGSTWLLLLPVISEAITLLPRLWAGVYTLAAFAVTLLPLVIAGQWDAILSGMMAYLAAIVFVAVFTHMMMSEQRAREALSAANQKLRDYAAKAEELATTQERNRLAREIHDGLGHYLTAVNIQIKAARAMLREDPDMAQTALDNAQNLAQEALADVRRSINALRADPATSRPLPETIETLLAEARAAGCEASLTIHGPQRPLPARVEFTLYRTAQEGLTNVRKHAQAAHVWLLLTYQEQSVGLQVRDDGVGSADQPGGGFGLTGLRERVELLGGNLSVDSAPGQGFTLRVEIPTPR